MRTVFLSSTARDLTAYREAAYHAIERLDGFHCVRMEDFGACAAQADDFCRAKIAECDVAVFVAGLCYGSRPEAFEESCWDLTLSPSQFSGIPGRLSPD